MSPAFAATEGLLEQTALRDFLPKLGSLTQEPLDRPPKPQHLVKLTTQTSLERALRELAAYNILSAPVIDPATQEYTGMLDVSDVLNALLHRVYPELLEPHWMETHKRLSMAELQAVGVDLGAQPIAAMVHGGDLWFRGDKESTLLQVVKSGFRVEVPHSPGRSLCHSSRVHHRVAVFDILPGEQTPDGPIPEWRVTQVVSQTDVLRLLASKVDDLAHRDPAYGAALSTLGLVQGAGGVTTVPASLPALSALALMQRERLSGVGVTGEPGGPLLANFSVSDLRGLLPERFGALALPTGAFLLFAQHAKAGGKPGGVEISWEDALLDRFPAAVREGRWAEALAGMPLVQVSPEATLAEALAALVHEGKHRVYVCDEEGRAVGAVTPSDVLRVVVAA